MFDTVTMSVFKVHQRDCETPKHTPPHAHRRFFKHLQSVCVRHDLAAVTLSNVSQKLKATPPQQKNAISHINKSSSTRRHATAQTHLDRETRAHKAHISNKQIGWKHFIFWQRCEGKNNDRRVNKHTQWSQNLLVRCFCCVKGLSAKLNWWRVQKSNRFLL